MNKISELRQLWVIVLFIVFMCASEALGEEYIYKNQGKRDPFMALITPTGYLLNLEPADDRKVNLEGIMHDPDGNSMAIVNGDLVRVGDSVGAAVVTEIEPNKIIILQDNEKIEIELRREE